MAGYPRVTHPSATKFKITRFHLNFVRLACVKHAASVHPEPGSNSHVEICSCQNIWLFPSLKLSVQAFGITVFRLFLNFSPVSSKQSFSLPFDFGILRILSPTGFVAWWASSSCVSSVRPKHCVLRNLNLEFSRLHYCLFVKVLHRFS